MRARADADRSEDAGGRRQPAPHRPPTRSRTGAATAGYGLLVADDKAPPGAARPRAGVRWASVAVVVGAVVIVALCLGAALRGRTWALVPGAVALAIAVREVRALKRGQR